MAARYVNTQNIAAQGQAFYTGLLPGTYEASGSVGGGNVMGARSGGTAGVGADRTASEAALLSIKDYKPDTGLWPREEKPQKMEIVDSDGKSVPPGPLGGGTTSPTTNQPPPGPLGGGTTSPTTPGNPQQPPASTGAPSWVAGLVTPQRRQQPPTTSGNPQQPPATPGNPQQPPATPGNPQNPTTGHGKRPSGSTSNPYGTRKPRSQGSAGKGPTDYIEDATMGQWGSFSGAVQQTASSRAHTRQSGVQQSATHQSFLYQNMANSTNRTLNF